jgi:hypothetical protein
MNTLLKNSLKLNTGPKYEQEIQRIFIVYYGFGELNQSEALLFTYPPLPSVYPLPNLNMNNLIKMSNESFRGYYTDWFTDQTEKTNKDEMYVLS